MKLGLINSAFTQAGKGTEFGIEQTHKIGFDAIDICADPLDIDVKERRLIKKTTERYRLPVTGVVCVAVGLMDFNPSVQRFNVDRVKAHLDLGYELEANNLLLVLGEYIWQQEIIPPQVQWQTAAENVRTCGEYARTLGLEIVLELEPFKLSMINNVSKMVAFLDDVNLPNVLANCDISHLYLAETPFEEVQKLQGRIGHVHLSDCDGKVHGDLPPGRGNTPIKQYLKAICDTGFDKTVSIELEYSPDPDRIVEWVREAYEKTDKIMQELKCRNVRN